MSVFRRLSKSKFGTAIVATGMLIVIGGFVVADLQNVGSGTLGIGMGSSTLAEISGERVTDRDMSDAMQRRLQQARQQNPEADYAAIAGDFERVLDAIIENRAIIAFAQKYGFHLSKRLVDAEIAQIPQTRGLNGQFSEQAYQGWLAQQRLTDGQVRQIIAGSLLQRLLLAPVGANPRVPVGMATPYASMLLEAREGQAATIPAASFRGGLNPSDADLQRFYAANGARYTVPEQRVVRIARIGPEQVNITATDAEIAAYYNANQASYGAKETRTLSQAVVPDRNTANAIAARAKAGGTLAAAAAPAGANAAVTTLRDQTRQAYSSLGGQQAAAAAFGAPSGAVVGPVQSDFGWVVVKVDSIRREGGKTLAQARSEIAERLTAQKRSQAIEDLVTRVQDAIDDGANYGEAAGQARLPVTTTPLIIANGTSRADPAYRAPQELAPAIQAGFEIAPNDPPEIVSLPDKQSYALVSPAQVVPAAPAPLASIRERVANDWITDQATRRARDAANVIAAKTARGVPLAQAVREVQVPLPGVRPIAGRRIDIANASGPVPPPIRMLFTLPQGKSSVVADAQSRGFFVVKVDKIVPGNALLQPALIGRMQRDLLASLSQDYAAQFMAAIRQDLKIRRNEAAIQAMKRRLISGGGS